MNPDTWAFDTHARLQDGRPSCLSLTLCHCHGRRTHLGLIRGCGYREPCGSAGQATIVCGTETWLRGLHVPFSPGKAKMCSLVSGVGLGSEPTLAIGHTHRSLREVAVARWSWAAGSWAWTGGVRSVRGVRGRRVLPTDTLPVRPQAPRARAQLRPLL